MMRETTPLGRKMLVLGILALAALSAWRLGQDPEGPARTRFAGEVMGTTWSVKLGAHAPAADADAVRAVIEGALGRVDRNLSTYRADSDVSRLSRAKASETVEVSRDALVVLALAREISAKTEGAFDVTVAPLVRAWGFGAGAQAPHAPSEQELTALRARVGYTKLEVDAAQGTARKTADGVEVDLSAIAKGYGVDEVAVRLEELGLTDYLVEVGGEIRVSGERAKGQPWRLAIEQPDEAGRAVHRLLRLDEGGALATSGDYRNFHEDEGRRVSHTIDPQSGRAVETQVASASVIANDCATADALATAVGVLGAERALAMAEKYGWAIYVLVRRDGKLEPSYSPAFAKYLEPEP